MDQWLEEIPSILFAPRLSSLQSITSHASSHAQNVGLAHTTSATPRSWFGDGGLRWSRPDRPHIFRCHRVHGVSVAQVLHRGSLENRGSRLSPRSR